MTDGSRDTIPMLLKQKVPLSANGGAVLLRDRGKHTIDVVVELGGVKPVKDDDAME